MAPQWAISGGKPDWSRQWGLQWPTFSDSASQGQSVIPFSWFVPMCANAGRMQQLLSSVFSVGESVSCITALLEDRLNRDMATHSFTSFGAAWTRSARVALSVSSSFFLFLSLCFIMHVIHRLSQFSVYGHLVRLPAYQV